MIKLAQAQQLTQKYCNVKITDHKGEKFRVEVRDDNGMLIWREWNFGDCSKLIRYIQQYGIEHQMFAHILHMSVERMPIIYLVITNDLVLESYKQYSAVMVSDQTQAEALALKFNAIIVTSDKATQ